MARKDSDIDLSQVPEAITQPGRQISIVWLIPLVAALIGAWLAYKTISEEGPTITISFKTAEGLEAEKTKIKYKNVDIGEVISISLSKDLSNIIVTAKLAKFAEQHLSENSRFWVVRARVAAGEVSGLSTILSGAYIGIDPGEPGLPKEHFEGLETPPLISADQPGRYFLLQTDQLGSLDIGSPIYYRQIRAGQVVAYRLTEDGQSIIINVFIKAPHDERIYANTRFWNASGFDMSIDTEGLKVHTESLITLIFGGIEFESTEQLGANATAKDGTIFKLYKSQVQAYEKAYDQKRHYVLYFDGSIRGLNIGAPVEFKGMQIGTVTDVKMLFDPDSLEFRLPVTIAIEPETIGIENSANRKKIVDGLVAQGMRAQLDVGNYLTGQLLVSMGFHPDATPTNIRWEESPPEFPTIVTPLEQITTTVSDVLNRLDDIPIAEISNEITLTMKSLKEMMGQISELSHNLNTMIAPAITATLEQGQKTLAAAELTLNVDSPVQQDLKAALVELTKAARSIRVMADYLERHPEALLRGKGNTQ